MINNFALWLAFFGALVIALLAWVLRVMGRQVREDYRRRRTFVTKSYDILAKQFAIVSAGSILFVGVVRHEWIGAIGFGAFAAAISATFWLNKPKTRT